MKLMFLGATHEVTGSCYYLEACGRRLLVEYGMEQGVDRFENAPLPVAPGEIDFVLLTHAHIDHSGKLPLLAKEGFSGQIHSTDATADLCDIMLRDSAHIQEFEAEWRNRKGKRADREPFVPLYTMEDAEAAIELFVPHPYHEKFELAPGIEVRFIDAGHLLGSASIEVWITEEGVTKKLVFSGDIGNLDQPIIRDPEYIEEADYVLTESTYGNRNHAGDRPDYVAELAEIMQRTFDRGGNLVIPSFAVGRTQEMLYFLREIREKNLVTGHDYIVYMDSPLAVNATNIFHDNSLDCYDKETMEILRRGINPISFPGLKLAVTAEESKAINFDPTPKVIISASGMCEAGRIKHHLKHNLWRKESTILFVGYQAVNTTGRAIVEGVESVSLFGERISVKAEIAQLTGMSGHADHDGLLEWIGHFTRKPEKVFVVHGDPEVCDQYAEELRDKGYDAFAPYSGTEFDLATGEFTQVADGRPIKKDYATQRAESMYNRLVAAGRRLMAVIERNRGGTNKNLAKFASQIESLSDKWEP